MPNAIPGRDKLDIEIFGMEGIPEEDMIAHEARISGNNSNKKSKSGGSGHYGELTLEQIQAQMAAHKAASAVPSADTTPTNTASPVITAPPVIQPPPPQQQQQQQQQYYNYNAYYGQPAGYGQYYPPQNGYNAPPPPVMGGQPPLPPQQNYGYANAPNAG